MIRLLTLLACLISLSACATVSRSTIDHFRIDTVPQGASVTTTVETDESRYARKRNIEMAPKFVGCAATPCALPLPRRSEFIATITHPGYEPAEVAIGYGSDTGAMAVSMAENIGAGTAGGVAAGAAVGGVSVAAAQFGAGIISAFSQALGGGAVTANTGGVVASATASGAVVGLAVGLGSVAVDSASGANLNLYPNPVILELAAEGTPTIIDPNVAPLREKLAQEQSLTKIACGPTLTPGAPTKEFKNCKRAKAINAERAAKLKTEASGQTQSDNSAK